MFRGTTPTYIFKTNDDIDLTIADKVYVTFSGMDEGEIMTKTDDALVVSADTIEVYLTQQETLSFPNGKIKVQINWLYGEEGRTKRACSQKMTIDAQKNLLDRTL